VLSVLRRWQLELRREGEKKNKHELKLEYWVGFGVYLGDKILKI
jgi:hypothetical protein